MPSTHTRRPRPTVLRLVLAAGIVFLAVGGYGMIRQPATTDSDLTATPTVADSPPANRSTQARGTVSEPLSTGSSEAPVAPALPKTNDSLAYASAVAERLHSWDTTTGLEPADYAAPILDDAVNSSRTDDADDLVADVARYLPTEQTWAHLRDYDTRQSLTIDRAYVPDTWDEAKAAAAARVPDGTVAVTLETTLQRHGRWNDESVSTNHRREFTVFLGCRPVYGRCHVLRLSAVNTPLR